ncbi:ferredoxin [Pseudonocardia sp. DR1-2]|uniref:ferredoxin n=1 Tax=Pseudonocardia sp. DR1-2 TaxID=2951168 RepID=UPI0020439406|nr:ferredoxin [Pseudonocardia sp. DR1-2]MCM3846636.1 ferredoxin [Pseudonocardia sp. DR1-2]
MGENGRDGDPAAWRIEVSPRCISAGLCLAIAPDHVEFAGVRARPTGAPLDEEGLATVRAAADRCPVAAITVEPGLAPA